MKKLLLFVSASALSLGLNTQANAAFINGSLSFAGGFNSLGDVVSPLTLFDIDSAALATGGTTDLSGAGGAAVASNINLNSPVGVIFVAGGFTFEMLAVSDISPTSLTCTSAGLCTDDIAFNVTGSVTGAGFDATAFAGTWTANGSCQGPSNGTSCDSNRSASWSSSVTALGVDVPPPVPEPATIALLAAGLFGVGATRRKA